MQNNIEHTDVALLRTLSRLEETNRKLLKSAKTRTAILLLLGALVILALVFALLAGQTVMELRQELHAATDILQALDIERLNGLIANIEQATDGLDQVDFASLNESIRSLHDIITPIANLFSPQGQ